MHIVRIIEVARGSGYWDERKQLEGHYFFLVLEARQERDEFPGEGSLLRIQDPLLIFRNRDFLISCEKYEICNLSE